MYAFVPRVLHVSTARVCVIIVAHFCRLDRRDPLQLASLVMMPFGGQKDSVETGKPHLHGSMIPPYISLL